MQLGRNQCGFVWHLLFLLDVYEMTNILGSLLPFRLPKSKPFIPMRFRVAAKFLGLHDVTTTIELLLQV